MRQAALALVEPKDGAAEADAAAFALEPIFSVAAENERDVLQRLRHRAVQRPEDGAPAVRLGEIFSLMAQGLRSKHIVKARPHIKPETIVVAHGFLMVHAPETYHGIVENSRKVAKAKLSPSGPRDIQVLVDENLTQTLLPSIRSLIGQPRHVKILGMAGTKDPELWAWCVNEGIDVILTKDRATGTDEDLTRIMENSARAIMRQHLVGELPKDRMAEASVEMVLNIMKTDMKDGDRLHQSYSSLPMVIHITDERRQLGLSGMKQADYIAMLLRKHQDRIFSYIEARNSPLIVLRHNKVECGPTYNELFMSVTRKSLGRLRHDFMEAHGDTLSEADRLQAAKLAYTERIFYELTRGSRLAPERLERALEMAKAAANRCGPGSEGAPMSEYAIRRHELLARKAEAANMPVFDAKVA